MKIHFDSLITAMLCGAIWLAIYFVVPQFSNLYERQQTDLPALTRVVLKIPRLAWLLIAIVVFITLAGKDFVLHQVESEAFDILACFFTGLITGCVIIALVLGSYRLCGQLHLG